MVEKWIPIVFWFLVFCFAGLYEAKKRGFFAKKKRGNTEAEDVDIKKLINDVLRDINCTGTWGDVEKEESVSYQYQGGHFRIRLENNSPYVKLMYLFFFETSVENIELVRDVCNQCNINADMVHVVYTFYGEDNKIHLHSLASLQLDKDHARQTLEQVMSEMFRWQNVFSRSFSEKINDMLQSEHHDYERECAETSRELFLLREQEIVHQDAGPDWRSSIDDGVCLNRFLSILFNLREVEPVRMEVVTEQGVETITDKDVILGYDMSTPLIADGKFIHESAMLNLVFTTAMRRDKERSVAIHLKKEKQGDQSLYYRISAMVIPLSIQPIIPFQSQETLLKSLSLLAAYDLNSLGQRLSEFRYMWKEINHKREQGNDDDLSEEERMLCDSMEPQLGYNIYYGMGRFREGRYYEALLYLVNTYNVFSPMMPKLNASQRDSYFNLCYYIGFCYCELKLFVEAHYYLEQTLPLHRITYTQEYVNCLVNGKDFRAMPFIDSLLLEIKESMGDDDDEKELQGAVKSFVSFLNRRKAYLYVEWKEFEKAEKMLKKMLDEPENMDFAIDELAFIQKVKGGNRSD